MRELYQQSSAYSNPATGHRFDFNTRELKPQVGCKMNAGSPLKLGGHKIIRGQESEFLRFRRYLEIECTAGNLTLSLIREISEICGQYSVKSVLFLDRRVGIDFAR
jgi:hypothetical protein